MHPNVKSVYTRGLLTIVASTVAAAMAGCGATAIPEPKPGKAVHVDSDLAVDPRDHEAVAGWADAIFVGTVEKYLQTQGRDPEMPETQFRVSVVDELKGDLPTKVVVNQFGGTKTGSNDIIIVNNSPILDANKTYLFIARYYAEKKWLTIATGFGALELTGADADAAKRADNNPANRDAEPEPVKNMRDAIAHEKPFSDQATRPKLPDAASLPSDVPGIPTPPETTSRPPTPTSSGQPHPSTTSSSSANSPTPTS